MKKLLSLVLILLLVLVFSACDGDTSSPFQHESPEPPPALLIDNIKDNDYKDEVINIVESNPNYSMYVEDMEYFYFITEEIDGFTLFRVLIDDGFVVYFYILNEEVEIGNVGERYAIGHDNYISVSIDRRPSKNPLDFLIELSKDTRHNVFYYPEDNTVYNVGNNDKSVSTTIGDYKFSLYARNSVSELNNDYETLRDLSYRIIESTELIQIK